MKANHYAITIVMAISLILLPLLIKPLVDISSAQEEEEGVVVNLPDILFAYGSAELTSKGRAAVRQIADVLNGVASGRRVAVDGHAEAFEGNEGETQALSEARAQTVARALIANGVSESRISLGGDGERYPIFPNSNPDGSDNPAGRARNRRVEVIIENRDPLIKGQVVNIPNIHFASGNAELTAEEQAKVGQIADTLNGVALGWRVAVEGHTDSFEREAQALSEARAQTVARALIANGVDKSRCTIRGYGERYPIALNTDPAGRAKNRRVEVVIENPAPPEEQKKPLEVVDKSKPPYLTSKVSLQDESGDNVLEGGGEKLTLQVTVKNEQSREGKPTGVARGVKVTISPKGKISGVTFPQSLDVGEIPPGAEKTVTGAFTADPDVPEGEVAFRIDAFEASHFDADPKEVAFNVIPFYKPVLRIGPLRVDAGTNQQIDLGEEVTLSLMVHNEGRGKADKVRAQLMIPSTDIKATDDTDKTVGDLSPGSWQEVKFSFAVTKRFTDQEIPLTVKLREDRAKEEASERITLPVNAYLPPPLIITLGPKTKEPGPGTVSPKLPELQLISDVDEYIQKFPKPAQVDRTKWGVVIGIETYRKAPNVPFARNDALAVREYMRKVFGIPKENIFFRFDDGATLGEMKGILEDRLPRQLAATKGGIVYVYFAGHGIASQDDGQPYLLPYDGDPESPKVTGYASRQLYDVLGNLKASQVHLFLDTCFSGGSRSGEMLLAAARPGILRVGDPVLASRNLFVLAAAKANQVSNGFEAQQHGLFTYYLLKGLMGEADRDEDKRVKAWELAEYTHEHVYRESRILFGQQRDQEPVVKPEGLGDRREWVIR